MSPKCVYKNVAYSESYTLPAKIVCNPVYLAAPVRIPPWKNASRITS